MKAFGIITRVLFIIAIPAFLFSLSIGIAVNSKWLYEAGFKKYDISQVTGITMPELNKAAAGIIDYFNNGDKYINVQIIKDGQPYQLYSEDQKEITHMKDVKALFWLDYKVLLASFIFIAAYIGVMLWRKNRKGLARALFVGGSLTLGLIIIIGIAILTGLFDTLFVGFHEIAFTNTDWLLDPNVDVLVMMFPDAFWQDAVSFIGLVTAGLAVISGGVGLWYIWKGKNSSRIK